MTATNSSYIVVGAGVFGASTAYHLIKKYPLARVILIDRTPFPSQVGASWDWNKVIRADYTSILYMEKALEAMQAWRHDPLFKEFYHESGLVWLDDMGLPQKIIDNYEKLKADEKYRMSHPEELKRLYDGLHRDADYTGVTNILINESSGWAEASKAITKLVEFVVAAGVKYVAATIESLQFGEQGSCTGVRTTSNDVLSATHIVLATGAYTAKLIADSAPYRAELQSGDRIIAAALVTGTVKLNPQQAERFKKGPVFIQGVGKMQGSSCPPRPLLEFAL
jgi:sarcosine oxidase / L-pipecolate oxidase